MDKEIFTEEGKEKQKALIGEFIINFENLNDWMRFIIPSIILKENLSNVNIKNIETLLTDLAAESLRSKFDSLIYDNFKSFPDFVNTNKILSKKVADLNQVRNSIAHGSYRLGWKDFEGGMSDESLSLRHSKPTKSGYEKRSKIISTSDLIELNENLLKVSSCYNSIAIIIRNIYVHKNKIQAIKFIEKLSLQVNNINKLKLDYLDILN